MKHSDAENIAVMLKYIDKLVYILLKEQELDMHAANIMDSIDTEEDVIPLDYLATLKEIGELLDDISENKEKISKAIVQLSKCVKDNGVEYTSMFERKDTLIS